MFRMKSSETKELTPELAAAHLAMTASPTERTIDDSRIKFLREKADLGQLIAFHWAVAELDGQTYRMNGQHSAKVLTSLNGQFPEGLTVHYDTFEVDSRTDLALLFRQFDARKSGRTPTDISGAYQGLHPDLASVPRAVAKLAIEGVAWFHRYVAGTMRVAGDNIYGLLDDTRFHPFVKWMGEMHSIKAPELQNPAVVAGMFATFEVNEEVARAWWPTVAKGGNDEAGDPATVLDAWLTRAATDGTRALNLKPGHLYQGTIYAWNAHRTNREIRQINVRIDKDFLDAEH